jgi:microsomal dipeptidase-like Zn-dependent dipeptidase
LTSRQCSLPRGVFAIIARVSDFCARPGSRGRLGVNAADVHTTWATRKIGAIMGVEGANFLQDDLGRVERVFADGVHVLTLVHYFRGR